MAGLTKLKSKFVCMECGYESIKWMGKCPECNKWNSLVEEVTQKAKMIAQEFATSRTEESAKLPMEITHRIPLPQSLSLDGRNKKVKSRGLDTIQYGHTNLELDFMEQLVDVNQTRAIGDIIQYAMGKYIDGRTSLREIVESIKKDIEEKGLDIISPYTGVHPGDYAEPRSMEIGGAINRLRILKVKQKI